MSAAPSVFLKGAPGARLSIKFGNKTSAERIFIRRGNFGFDGAYVFP